MDHALVAKLGAITNLTHGFIYFSPVARAAYSELGLSEAQQYFASRGAALGRVPASVIAATFFNFNPAAVEAGIPSAWDVAAPEDIQTARMKAAGDQLAALGALDEATLTSAIDLAGAIADAVGYEGKALAAANREVPEPDDPWQRLWQRLTVIREWRGDAHVAVLTAAPVTAVEALVLHAATGQVSAEVLLATRRWEQREWDAAIERLADRGLVDANGAFTEEGDAYRAGIEDRTNMVCAPLVEAIGAAETRHFIDLLKPVRTALMDSGAFAALGGART